MWVIVGLLGVLTPGPLPLSEAWTRAKRPPAMALYNSVVVAARCQVINVWLPTPDRTTWHAVYDATCTPEQRAAGNAAISDWKD